jgi:hypothetical protein
MKMFLMNKRAILKQVRASQLSINQDKYKKNMQIKLNLLNVLLYQYMAKIHGAIVAAQNKRRLAIASFLLSIKMKYRLKRILRCWGGTTEIRIGRTLRNCLTMASSFNVEKIK